jgi:hypothetical protein
MGAKQPCLICGRQPCDAHHLRFAQPRGLASRPCRSAADIVARCIEPGSKLIGGKMPALMPSILLANFGSKRTRFELWRRRRPMVGRSPWRWRQNRQPCHLSDPGGVCAIIPHFCTWGLERIPGSPVIVVRVSRLSGESCSDRQGLLRAPSGDAAGGTPDQLPIRRWRQPFMKWRPNSHPNSIRLPRQIRGHRLPTLNAPPKDFQPLSLVPH